MSELYLSGDILGERIHYALGVVAYEMLAGRVPFGGTTPHAVLHKHVYEAPPPLRAVARGIPPGVEKVINRALAKDVRKRYQSAGEMAEALRTAIGQAAERQDRGRRATLLLEWRGTKAPIFLIVAALLALFVIMAASPVPTLVMGPASTLIARLNSTPAPTQTQTRTLSPTRSPTPTKSVEELRSPTPTPKPTSTIAPGTPTPKPTSTLFLATTTPLPSATVPGGLYPAPILVSPADGESPGGDRVTLRWNWDGTLKDNERFDVWVWKVGQEPTGGSGEEERTFMTTTPGKMGNTSGKSQWLQRAVACNS